MGLTSGLFIWLMTALAVGSLAATVGLWPRAAGRGIGSLAARLGMVGVSQVLVIAAFLAFLNGYFSFYGSWPQLFGTGAPQPVPAAAAAVSWKPIVVIKTEPGPAAGRRAAPSLAADNAPGPGQQLPRGLNHGPGWPGNVSEPHPTASLARSPAVAAVRRLAGVGVRSPVGVEAGSLAGGVVQSPVAGAVPSPAHGVAGSAARDPAAVGKILQVTIRGQRTGIGVSGDYVYLPPQYFQPGYAQSRFPVVLALTGYPGSAGSIVKRLGLPGAAARLVAAGRIGPAIYVMMNVSVAMPRDTECANVPAGPQVESFFAQDVPQAVERTFRTQTAASGWAVVGYSTGGYCAAKLAMMNPYRFASAVSIAGYFTALNDDTTGNIYGGSNAYRNENNLDWRLTHLPAPPVSVLATSSKIGERTYPGTLAFLGLVHSPMRGYSLILPQGGHNFRTWSRELPQSLQWLNLRLTPARAAQAAATSGQQLSQAARALASRLQHPGLTPPAAQQGRAHRGSRPPARPRPPGRHPAHR